jgi:hypothetical protein
MLMSVIQQAQIKYHNLPNFTQYITLFKIKIACSDNCFSRIFHQHIFTVQFSFNSLYNRSRPIYLVRFSTSMPSLLCVWNAHYTHTHTLFICTQCPWIRLTPAPLHDITHRTQSVSAGIWHSSVRESITSDWKYQSHDWVTWLLFTNVDTISARAIREYCLQRTGFDLFISETFIFTSFLTAIYSVTRWQYFLLTSRRRHLQCSRSKEDGLDGEIRLDGIVWRSPFDLWQNVTYVISGNSKMADWDVRDEYCFFEFLLWDIGHILKYCRLLHSMTQWIMFNVFVFLHLVVHSVCLICGIYSLRCCSSMFFWFARLWTRLLTFLLRNNEGYIFIFLIHFHIFDTLTLIINLQIEDKSRQKTYLV